MRKLNLKDYTVHSKAPDNMNPGKLIDIEFPYPFKDSLLNIMFRRELQLSGAELVKQNVLAMKLEQCKDDEVLLEDEEYARVKNAVEKCTGFSRNDVELVTRILGAEVVEVEPKK